MKDLEASIFTWYSIKTRAVSEGSNDILRPEVLRTKGAGRDTKEAVGVSKRAAANAIVFNNMLMVFVLAFRAKNDDEKTRHLFFADAHRKVK
jgi:hypothetical protein